MVKDEAKRLEVLAKVIHLCCEDGRSYGRSEWQDIVVDAGLGIDSRTAASYFRLAKVRMLIHEHTVWRWCKGEKLTEYLRRPEINESQETGSDREDV